MNSAMRIRSSSRLTRRIEHEVRQHGERDDECDRQPQVAADLRQGLGEVDFAEFRFERRGERQARKAALQLQGVRGLRRGSGRTVRVGAIRVGAAHAAIRQARDASAPAWAQRIIPGCWRRSRASLMQRRQTS